MCEAPMFETLRGRGKDPLGPSLFLHGVIRRMVVIALFAKNLAISPVNAPKRKGGPLQDILRALGRLVHILLVTRESLIPRAVH